MGTRPGIHLAVIAERSLQATARLVELALLRTLRRRRVRRAALEVYVVSDAVMREVNRRTRGIDAPTTVLSFSALPLPKVASGDRRGAAPLHSFTRRGATASAFPYPPARDAPYLGEIYLAPRYIRSHGEYLSHLAVHALLHLLGYTHEGQRDTIEMEAEERRLLA